MTQHVVVADATHIPAVLAVRYAGWTANAGFDLGAQPWDVTERRIVCHGEVTGPDEVSAASLCAARGAALVVAIADLQRWSAFVEDLRHLGRVDFADAAPVQRAPALDDDQRRLLRMIASGLSLTEAARELFMSQRTAERKVAGARKTLGVTSTAEAIAVLDAAGVESNEHTTGGTQQ